MANPIDLGLRIMQLLDSIGIKGGSYLGKASNVKKAFTGGKATFFKPNALETLRAQDGTFIDALTLIEDEAKFIANATDVEKMAFLNNLTEYKSLGGPKKTKGSGITALDQANNLTDEAGDLQTSVEDLMGLTKKMKDEAETGKKKALQDLDDFFTTGGQPFKKKDNKFLGGSMHEESQIRTGVRQFLQNEYKNGRLKLDNVDIQRIMKYSPMLEDDPIKVFKKIYGEEAYNKAGSFPGKFEVGKNYNHYEQIFRENMGDELLTIKNNEYKGDGKLVLTEQEEIFKPTPDDDVPFAEGGLAALLGEPTGYYTGGRAKFARGLHAEKPKIDFQKLLGRRMLRHNDQPVYIDKSKLRDLLEALDGGSGIFPGYDIKNDLPKEMEAAEGGRAGLYTGGMVDVEPNLSDIGHGSDSLMARTRLVSPGSQATTSTGLNYLLAEDNDNIRVPFSKGLGVDLTRRGFLKVIAGTAGAVAALKSGALKLLGKSSPKAIPKIVEIGKGSGVPEWFEPMVNKVLADGLDVTKGNAFIDGQVVKRIDTPSGQVDVYHNQRTGEIDVEYASETHAALGDSVHLNYKPGMSMADENVPNPPDEFMASENIPEGRQTSPDDYDIEIGENTVDEVGGLFSDTSELEKLGGQNINMREILKNIEKKKKLKKMQNEPSDFVTDVQGDYDPT